MMAEDRRGDKICILVTGKTGGGKSATCNTIVGSNLFQTSALFRSATTTLQYESVDVAGQRLMVVDTPGFFDTEISEEAVFDNAVRSLMVAHPGPHAVLFVLRAGLRFTDEEQKAYNRLKRVFGEDVVNHIIIALTYGDVLEEEGCTLDDIKNDANEKLTTVFRQCGHRCIVFNNKQPGNETRDLIREIQNLGRGPFTQGNSLLGMTQQAVESEVRRRVRASQEVELRNDPHGQRLQSENEAYERELENVRREAAAGLNKALVASVVGLAVGAVVAVFVPPNVAVALTAEAVTKPRCVVS